MVGKENLRAVQVMIETCSSFQAFLNTRCTDMWYVPRISCCGCGCGVRVRKDISKDGNGEIEPRVQGLPERGGAPEEATWSPARSATVTLIGMETLLTALLLY